MKTELKVGYWFNIYRSVLNCCMPGNLWDGLQVHKGTLSNQAIGRFIITKVKERK